MKVTETALPGVLRIEPPVFVDERGSFLELWHAERYRRLGIGVPFVQDNFSHSHRGVLRGLHYQRGQPQAKLVQVLRGEVYDVVVDIRRGSPHFGRWVGVTLSETNRHQLFIPVGFAHGFYVLSESADFHYKCSDFYAPPEERGVRWDDPALAIAWPPGPRIVHPRDAAFPLLHDAGDDLPLFSG